MRRSKKSKADVAALRNVLRGWWSSTLQLTALAFSIIVFAIALKMPGTGI